MTRETLARIVTLGALTGMRSTAGLTTLALGRGGVLRPLTLLATAGEMAADKTAAVGNRTDALPLVGRAAFGALVGALVARERHDDVVLASLIGAATAVATTHLAYRWRTRLAPAGVAGGMLEDAFVVAMASGARGLLSRR